MPIYAYKCGACGKPHDALQKMSDPALSVCPHCGAAALTKQVTAAGFQLKGSGWYVTDFRDGNKGGDKAGDKGADKGSDKASDKASESTKATDGAAPAAAPSSSPAPAASPTPAPAPAPASSSTTPTQG